MPSDFFKINCLISLDVHESHILLNKKVRVFDKYNHMCHLTNKLTKNIHTSES